MELYTPSDKLEGFYNHTGFGRIQHELEGGRTRNLPNCDNEPQLNWRDGKGYLCFIRWYERRQFLNLGYALLSAGLGFPLILLAEAIYKIIKMS